jgi:hypothetical protein
MKIVEWKFSIQESSKIMDIKRKMLDPVVVLKEKIGKAQFQHGNHAKYQDTEYYGKSIS